MLKKKFYTYYQYLLNSMTSVTPGLYDDNDNLLASWDRLVNNYGLNLAKSGIVYPPATTTSSILYILNNNEEFANATKLVTGSDLTSIGDAAFGYSATNPEWRVNLKFIDLSGSTKLTTLGTSIFNGCAELTTVILPLSISSITNSMFKDCGKLTSVDIPRSVTKISEDAFYGCETLPSLVIPASVTIIQGFAFTGCDALTLYCEAASKPSGWASYWNYVGQDINCPVVWGYKK